MAKTATKRAKTTRGKRPGIARASAAKKQRRDIGRKGGLASGKARRATGKAKGTTTARRGGTTSGATPPAPTA
jgi:general stress protein YciG